MTIISNGLSPAGRRIHEAGMAFQKERSDPKPAEEPKPARRLLFTAPIEPARPAAAFRDVGKGQCRAIMEEVAAKHGVTVRDILSGRRARALIPPRHEAMYRCVAESPLSLPVIGRIFGRDHTTIGYAVMRHHLNTGDPLPRGMDWKVGRRKRHG